MVASIDAPERLTNKYFWFLQFLYISDTNAGRPVFAGRNNCLTIKPMTTKQ